MKIESISLRFVVFLGDFLEDADLEHLLKLFPEADQIPTKNPIPKSEDLKYVPWVTISNDEIELSIARKRIDFAYKLIDTPKSKDEIGLDLLKRTFVKLHEERGDSFERVSFVARFFIEANVGETAEAAFASKFLSIVKDGDSSSLGARYASKINVKLGSEEDFVVNNFVSVDSGSVGSRSGIIIQRDFNTDAKMASQYKGRFKADSLSSLIEWGTQKYNLKDWVASISD